MRCKEAGRRTSSLKDGTMMESWNADVSLLDDRPVIVLGLPLERGPAFPRRACSEFPLFAKGRNHTPLPDCKSEERYGYRLAGGSQRGFLAPAIRGRLRKRADNRPKLFRHDPRHFARCWRASRAHERIQGGAWARGRSWRE